MTTYIYVYWSNVFLLLYLEFLVSICTTTILQWNFFKPACCRSRQKGLFTGGAASGFFKYRRNWPVVFESTDFERLLILRGLGIEKNNCILSCFLQLHISENNWFIVLCYLFIYISNKFYHPSAKWNFMKVIVIREATVTSNSAWLAMS